MYNFLLHFHSGLRWIVLLVVVVIILKSLVGFFSGSAYKKFDSIIAASFVGMMHLQFILGIILYFFYSPYVTYEMSDAQSRFWSVEHTSLMLLAVVVAQIGRTLSKKTQKGQVKFRFQFIFFGISLVLMLLGIPWDRV